MVKYILFGMILFSASCQSESQNYSKNKFPVCFSGHSFSLGDSLSAIDSRLSLRFDPESTYPNKDYDIYMGGLQLNNPTILQRSNATFLAYIYCFFTVKDKKLVKVSFRNPMSAKYGQDTIQQVVLEYMNCFRDVPIGGYRYPPQTHVYYRIDTSHNSVVSEIGYLGTENWK